MKYLPRPYDSITNDYVKSQLVKLQQEQEIHRTSMGYGNEVPNQNFAEMGGYFANGGIHIKPSHKGRFTAYKERTGKTTEEALHSKDPHVRQMANFARNAAKWKHDGTEESSFIQRKPKDDSTFNNVMDTPNADVTQSFINQEYNPDIPDEQALTDASHNRIMTKLNTRPVTGVEDNSDYQPDRYKNTVDWKDLGILAGNSAAGITNLVSGLQKRKYPNYQRLHPDEINYRVAAENAGENIRRSYNPYLKEINNSNTSSGRAMALKAQAASEVARLSGDKSSEFLTRQEAENVGIRNNAKQINTGISNAQTDEKFKTDAAYRLLLNKGISQMGEAGANYLKDKKLDNSDEARMAYVKKLYPYLFPGTTDLTKIK